jgi:hypothetical protein
MLESPVGCFYPSKQRRQYSGSISCLRNRPIHQGRPVYHVNFESGLSRCLSEDLLSNVARTKSKSLHTARREQNGEPGESILVRESQAESLAPPPPPGRRYCFGLLASACPLAESNG